MFAFVSGYGLYKSYLNNENDPSIIRRAVKFLITYWTMLLLVAVPYLVIVNKFNIDYFFINLFGLLHNDDVLYLSFSWYVKVYLEVLIILPIVKKIIGQINNITLESFLFVFLPIIISAFLPNEETYFFDIWTSIISSIRLLFTWYPIFHIGVIFSKYKIYDLIKKKVYFARSKLLSILISLFGMLIAILLRKMYVFSLFTDALCVLVFVFFYAVIQRESKNMTLNKLLAFLGKYSFQFWLLSGMFFLNTTEFQWVLVLPKNSVLILLWTFILITPLAVLMSKISGLIITVFNHATSLESSRL